MRRLIPHHLHVESRPICGSPSTRPSASASAAGASRSRSASCSYSSLATIRALPLAAHARSPRWRACGRTTRSAVPDRPRSPARAPARHRPVPAAPCGRSPPAPSQSLITDTTDRRPSADWPSDQQRADGRAEHPGPRRRLPRERAHLLDVQSQKFRPQVASQHREPLAVRVVLGYMKRNSPPMAPPLDRRFTERMRLSPGSGNPRTPA